jgi:hypothetical protein
MMTGLIVVDDATYVSPRRVRTIWRLVSPRRSRRRVEGERSRTRYATPEFFCFQEISCVESSVSSFF